MTFGQKLKNIRKSFGFSQEQLANIMKVSRQAITKWESDMGLPDVSNLKELSKVFGMSVDSLLNNQEHLPCLHMRVELDKKKYKNKLSSYNEVLREYYSNFDIYVLTREKKMNKLEFLIDFFIGGFSPEAIYPIETADVLSDLSPYYLVCNGDEKLLVNIKDWFLDVSILPSDINVKKFVYGKNKFKNCGKLNVNKL